MQIGSKVRKAETNLFLMAIPSITMATTSQRVGGGVTAIIVHPCARPQSRPSYPRLPLQRLWKVLLEVNTITWWMKLKWTWPSSSLPQRKRPHFEKDSHRLCNLKQKEKCFPQISHFEKASHRLCNLKKKEVFSTNITLYYMIFYSF